MNYEKKYKDLVKAVKELQEINPSDEGIQNWVNDNVPELAESEDEKIRKAIISAINNICNGDEGLVTFNGFSKEQVLTWLEKQGKKEYALKSFKDEDVRKFVQCIEKQAKAYEFNLPNRGYDIYAFAKDLLVWLEKQGEQKPAEWSEEDDEIIHSIEQCIYDNIANIGTINRYVDWLESLRPQNTWKPSEEQMKILSIYENVNDVLASLYQDLKKLK